jgi:hypothetical protein
MTGGPGEAIDGMGIVFFMTRFTFGVGASGI